MLCDHCRGVGAERPEDVETCSLCGGRGVREVHQQMAPGFVMRQEVQYVARVRVTPAHPCRIVSLPPASSRCNKCGGKGKTVKRKCSVCGGNKVIRGSNQITVDIERGMPDGFQVVRALIQQPCEGKRATGLTHARKRSRTLANARERSQTLVNARKRCGLGWMAAAGV